VSRAHAIAALALLCASCAPDFKDSSRVLARGAPSQREPIAERRTTYFDAEHSRIRRQWHVLIQPDNSVVLHGKDVQYFADGSLEHERQHEHGEAVGLWRSYWPGGTPRMEATYGAKEPQPMRWWHQNGQLSSEGPARNGLKEGAWTFWHENGERASTGKYARGRREGEWSFWNADGTLRETQIFRKNVRVDPTPPATGGREGRASRGRQ
jgi:hypothetical protein